MILGHSWMKKYGVLLNVIDDCIIFSSRYCIHLGASLSLISPKPEEIETIPEARQQDIFPNRILKKGSDENLNDFLQTLRKISNKK